MTTAEMGGISVVQGGHSAFVVPTIDDKRDAKCSTVQLVEDVAHDIVVIYTRQDSLTKEGATI